MTSEATSTLPAAAPANGRGLPGRRTAAVRFGRIAWTIARYRLLDHLPVPPGMPGIGLRVLRTVLRLVPAAPGNAGARLRGALEHLGPVFVKFGQLLSTRRDLLEPAIADELALLQDRVPPFSADVARHQVETALGARIDSLFRHFEREPMASASVAQVHAATLADGSDVVVKILRPDIAAVIDADLALMYQVAHAIERWLPDARRLHPVDIVSDYDLTIHGELDLEAEAANQSRLRRNWMQSDLLYVPRVHWDHVRRNVLVMERIYGVPVSDLETLRARGTDLKKLAERGVEIFFTQVFKDNFFHADMHPGNVYVDISDPAEPSYIALDCAIMGSLTEADRDYLAGNVMAVFNRDYRRVAELHVESGWVPADAPVNELTRVVADVCEPILEKPLAEISFGRLLVDLFAAARRFNVEVQPQLVLLQKTLLNIEGLGRELYPQLDLWQTGRPFLTAWMVEQRGPAAMLRQVADQLPEIIADLPRWLAGIGESGRRIERLQREVSAQTAVLRDLDGRTARAERGRRNATLTLIAGSGAAAVALLSQGEAVTPMLANVHWSAWLLAAIAAVTWFKRP